MPLAIRFAAPLVAVVACAGACDRSTPNEGAAIAAAGDPVAPAPAKPRGTKMDSRLTWRMELAGKTLRVHYTVNNPGASPIWVVDDMLTHDGTGYHRSPEALVVRRGDAAGEVSLYRGNLSIPDRRVANKPIWFPPGVREVPPGGRLDGLAETPLPLAAWHNYQPAKMPALEGTPARAVLEVQILETRGTPSDWAEVALADGKTIKSPIYRFLESHAKILRAGPEPLP